MLLAFSVNMQICVCLGSVFCFSGCVTIKREIRDQRQQRNDVTGWWEEPLPVWALSECLSLELTDCGLRPDESAATTAVVTASQSEATSAVSVRKREELCCFGGTL